MKTALFAVVSELYGFVVLELAGLRRRLGHSGSANTIPLLAAPSGTQKAIKVEYVYAAEQDLDLHSDPAHSFDNVLRTIPYGAALRNNTLHESGVWINVEYGGVRGWVMREKVALLPRTLVPAFEASAHYDAYHAETEKLRIIINDEFRCGALGLPLTDAEYAVYRLGEKRKQIPWGDARPRIPGTWHQLLKGDSRVRADILPRQNSIMEYVADGIGHVAFVEAVFPGFAIHISEVGEPEEGMYTERTLTRDEWREYRPVFISVKIDK